MNDKDKELMEHIDQLVFQYQEGCEESGEALLRYFGCHPAQWELSSYIGKYYSILRFGRFNFADRDSRKFISSFISDAELRKKMKPWYQYKEVKTEVRKIVDHVVGMCLPIPDEDLKQDLRMLFLQQARRYKKTRKNVNFPGYLYNSYRYAVKNHITKLFKAYEPYMHMPGKLKALYEDVSGDETTLIPIDDITLEDTPIMMLDDELGNNWVRGLTCGEEFEDLTPLQRLILKMHYQEGMSDRKIADQLGLHINTVFRQRTKTIKQVEDNVERIQKEGRADE